MGEKEKVTIMVLKVDLQCEKCYRKVKKVLCKFPQIRDQAYDEKNNLVNIKVVCCSPEKIRDKLCCKGGGAIKSIEIKEPKAAHPPAKPKPPPATTPPPATAPPPQPPRPSRGQPKPRPAKPVELGNPTSDPDPDPAAFRAYPTPTVSACFMDCYGGHRGGPCQTGYGAYGGAAPNIQYDGYYGRPVYDSYSGGRSYATSSYCVTRPDCFSEENPQACTIM